jgi:hypothetical protein
VSPRRTTGATLTRSVIAIGWAQRKDTDMINDATSWHHTPLGRRVMTPQAPYFVISAPSPRRNRDGAARRALADLAGL